jgi:hypothetical protein
MPEVRFRLHHEYFAFDNRRESNVIDPRGTRFSAAVTSAVLALVVLTAPSPLAILLISVQTLVFALGALFGPGAQPYGWMFRRFVRPRLQPPTELEEPLPPQFAQAVGLGFAMAASLSMLIGWTVGVWLFAGGALVAALLNAVFGFCLGCEIYLRVRRFIPEGAMPPAARAELVGEGSINLTDPTSRV